MAEGSRTRFAERRAQVVELLARRSQDSKTLKQLAAEAGIRLSTLYGWSQRLRREGLQDALTRKGATGRKARFVEVAVPDRSPSAKRSPFDSELCVELATGCRIHVSAGFHEDVLRRVLAVLTPRC